jgi:hypothetical protein
MHISWTSSHPRSSRLRVGLLITGLLGLSLVGAQPVSAASSAAPCTPTDKLVNPCRPWLGAYGHGYPQVPPDLVSQIQYHEKRVGRRGDIVRGNYHVGNKPLTAAEVAFARRPSTILLINWKPTKDNWAAAGGGHAPTNAVIDAMATSIKSVAPRKIMLALWHEPENDVSSGTRCPTNTTPETRAGSPADYRSMWANVQRRFAAKGAKNVIWVMNYMGYKPWDCLVPELWPGNSRVDWLMMDPYGTPGRAHINNAVGRFYRHLEGTSDATHNYRSKPWGLAEFSAHSVKQPDAYAYWDSFKAALDAKAYPRLKAYVVFDSDGGHPDNRVAYGMNGVYDAVEQARYNAFAHHPAFGVPIRPLAAVSGLGG